LIRPDEKPVKHMEYVPGQVVIKFEEPAVRPHFQGALPPLTTAATRFIPSAVLEPLQYLRTNAGLGSVVPIFSPRVAQVADAAVRSSVRDRLAVAASISDEDDADLAGINVLSLDPRKVTPSLLRRVNAANAVTFAQRVPARWLASPRRTADPERNVQWSLRAISWFQANRPSIRGVRVAILDTGIDKTHPEFDGVHVEYHHAQLSQQDIVGHGTHVAGTIAAQVNNQVGIAGVANCGLAVWKIFGDAPASDGQFYVDPNRYYRALRDVARSGALALNLSLGGTVQDPAESRLISVIQRAGVAVVAAMGNEYELGNPTVFPAAFEGVNSVGAIDVAGRRASFSSTGRHIDLVAPGVGILSTVPRRRNPHRNEVNYTAWDGTSMATPHVTAAVALTAMRFADMAADDVRRHLRSRATRLPAMGRRSWTQEYGTGLLNLQSALT